MHIVACMPMKSTSRRRTAAGEVVQIRLRDRQQLVALRRDRPDEKGRPGRSLSQRQAAVHLGISHGHYGDIEAGRRHPSLAVAERIAAFFSVPLEELCRVEPAGDGRGATPRGSAREVVGQVAGGDQGEALVAGEGDGAEAG